MTDKNPPTNIEAELRASEERFSKVFDASPSMIAITTLETGKIYAVNQAWVDAFGHTREEAVGKTALELNLWPDVKDREAFVTEFQKRKTIRNYEARMMTKDGQALALLVNGDQIEFDREQRLLLVINDITARKKAEGKLQATLEELERQVVERTSELSAQIEATRQAQDELLDSELRLQQANRMLHLVLDTIPVRVFWKDKDLSYLGCNRRFAMDAGFSSPNRVTGRHEQDMPWSAEAEFYNGIDNEVMATGRAQLGFERQQVTVDGDLVWVRISKIPLRDGEGEVIGVLGMHEDITQAKQAEQAMKQAKDAAEAASQAKSSFLSSMSHELRTPLNAILGFSQLLEYDPARPLEPQQKESVEHIKSGGKHLLSLINEILDLAKIEAGHAEFDIQPVEAGQLFYEVMPLISTLADKHGVTLHAPALDAPTAVISVDFIRAKQVLLNLLSNAVKYNRANGSVTLDVEDNGDFLRIIVNDTGKGIPEHKIAELFEPFSRLGAEETEIEGTGIGLTITRELVDKMGGRMGVDSVVGVGSTFWVDFPLSRDETREKPEENLEGKKDFLSGRVEDAGFDGTVLYVEDNAANMLFLESVFERFANLRLITATNAEEGIAMAKAENPDMLILDVSLPGMSGTDAVRQLRSEAGFEGKPIIALSANAMQSHIDAGLEAGFDAYLTKPLDIQLLMHELKKVFGKVVVED